MARASIYRPSMLDVEYIAFALARELMEYDEPIPPFQTRFPGRLESCVRAPFQTYARKSLYKGVVGKGAALFYLMVKNHPFQNGNKRIAVTALFYYLMKNRRDIRMSNEDVYEFARKVAMSNPANKDTVLRDIEAFIERHCALTSPRGT